MFEEELVLPAEKLREAQCLVEEFLRSTFPNTNFVSVRIKPALDHYGDPVLRVDTYYRGSAAEIDCTKGYDTGMYLWRRLRAVGITAFPVHLFRDVDEKPYGRCS